jgi:hypothetical protein
MGIPDVSTVQCLANNTLSSLQKADALPAFVCLHHSPYLLFLVFPFLWKNEDYSGWCSCAVLSYITLLLCQILLHFFYDLQCLVQHPDLLCTARYDSFNV